uniref:Uncharacterized protein n=1 Tax=Apteryx owenii TaxID=8824 RepID=A0A8B9PLY1_APTOW
MLARFRALAGARAALARQAEAGQEQLAAEQARLRRYREEASSELLRRSNQLAQLQDRLEAARREVHQGVRSDPRGEGWAAPAPRPRRWPLRGQAASPALSGERS